MKKLSSSGKALELEAVQLKKKAAELKKKYDGAERIVGLMSRQRSGRDVKVFKDAGTQADGPAAPQVPSLGFSTVMTLVDSPPVTVAARPLMIEDNTQTPAESEQGVTGALKGTTVSGSQTGAHAPSRTVEDDRDATISSLRKEVDELMEEVEQRCGELNQRDNDVRKLQHRLEKQTKLMESNVKNQPHTTEDESVDAKEDAEEQSDDAGDQSEDTEEQLDDTGDQSDDAEDQSDDAEDQSNDGENQSNDD